MEHNKLYNGNTISIIKKVKINCRAPGVVILWKVFRRMTHMQMYRNKIEIEIQVTLRE